MRHAGKALPLLPLAALAVGEGDLRDGLERGEDLSGLANWGLGFDEGNGEELVR